MLQNSRSRVPAEAALGLGDDVGLGDEDDEDPEPLEHVDGVGEEPDPAGDDPPLGDDEGDELEDPGKAHHHEELGVDQDARLKRILIRLFARNDPVFTCLTIV